MLTQGAAEHPEPTGKMHVTSVAPLRRRQPQAGQSLSIWCTTSIMAGADSRVKPAAAEWNE